jgi:homoserine dehydrogenase
MNKKAQEEMIGFGVILVIIGIIILISVSLMASNKKTLNDSFLLESFILSALESNTNCSYNYEDLRLRDLMVYCYKDYGECENKNKSLCLMLNESIKKMVEEGFQISNSSYYKAYDISLKLGDKIVKINKNNATSHYYQAIEEFQRSNENYAISLKLFF